MTSCHTFIRVFTHGHRILIKHVPKSRAPSETALRAKRGRACEPTPSRLLSQRQSRTRTGSTSHATSRTRRGSKLRTTAHNTRPPATHGRVRQAAVEETLLLVDQIAKLRRVWHCVGFFEVLVQLTPFLGEHAPWCNAEAVRSVVLGDLHIIVILGIDNEGGALQNHIKVWARVRRKSWLDIVPGSISAGGSPFTSYLLSYVIRSWGRTNFDAQVPIIQDERLCDITWLTSEKIKIWCKPHLRRLVQVVFANIVLYRTIIFKYQYNKDEKLEEISSYQNHGNNENTNK